MSRELHPLSYFPETIEQGTRFLKTRDVKISNLSTKKVERILAKNLGRKKPSRWVNLLAYECLDLSKAIDYQRKAFDIHRRKFEREKLEFTTRINQMSEQLVEAELELRKPKKKFKRLVQALLEELE